MGAVYEATQLSLNRVVALKLLAPNLSEDPGFRARFEREGQVQAALDHEHIVSVYEAGQSEYVARGVGWKEGAPLWRAQVIHIDRLPGFSTTLAAQGRSHAPKPDAQYRPPQLP